MRTQRLRRPGFSLLEFIVVALLVLLLVGIGMMLLNRHRDTDARLHCTNNLRRIGIATQAYSAGTSGNEAQRRLPPSRIDDGYATWGVLLMPHLENGHRLQNWRLSQTYFDQEKEVREAVVSAYFCPARPRDGVWISRAGDLQPATKTHVPGALGDYAAVAASGPPWLEANANGAMIVGQVLQRDGGQVTAWQGRVLVSSLARGASYTLLIGEKHVPNGHQADAADGDGSLYNGDQPASFARLAGPGYGIAPSPDAPFNRDFGSHHTGYCLFLNADGSVRTLAPSVPEVLLGKLSQRE